MVRVGARARVRLRDRVGVRVRDRVGVRGRREHLLLLLGLRLLLLGLGAVHHRGLEGRAWLQRATEHDHLALGVGVGLGQG